MNRRAFIALCGAAVACPTVGVSIIAPVPARRIASISNPYLTEKVLQELERIAVRPANINGKNYYFVTVRPEWTREANCTERLI